MQSIRMISFTASAFGALATTIIMPILAPLIRELDLTEIQGGAMISIGSLIMALCAPLWGRYFDTRGRKFVLILGFGGIFVGYVLFTMTIWAGLSGFWTGTMLFVLLVITRTFLGMFLSVPQMGAQALMADITKPEERSSGMAVVSAGMGTGTVVGPAIGGALAALDLILPLAATTVLGLLGLVFVAVGLPNTAKPVAGDRDASGAWSPQVVPWIVFCLVNIYAVMTFQICAGFYIQDTLQLENSEVAPLLAIALTCVGVALVLTQIAQIKLLKWESRRMVIVGALHWIASIVVLLTWTNVFAYHVSYVLAGIGVGLLIPGYVSGASLATPAEHQGSVSGWIATAIGTSGVLAPITSTLLYTWSINLPFEIVIALMVLVILVAMLLGRNSSENAR